MTRSPLQWLRILLPAALAGHWLVMAVLTHLPRAPIVPHVTDKTAHFSGFGALAALLYLWLWASGRASAWTGLFVLIILSVYGALDEVTQPLSGRTCSFLDWMADLSGAALAVMAVGTAHWLVARRRSRAGR